MADKISANDLNARKTEFVTIDVRETDEPITEGIIFHVETESENADKAKLQELLGMLKNDVLLCTACLIKSM